MKQKEQQNEDVSDLLKQLTQTMSEKDEKVELKET